MVDKRLIRKSINNAILCKCGPTIAEMKERLSGLSYDDRIGLLDGKLTPLEQQDYLLKLHDKEKEIEEIEEEIREESEEYFEEYGEYLERPSRYLRDSLANAYGELDNELFQYDRRIFTDYEIGGNDPPIVDWDKYVYDENGEEHFDPNSPMPQWTATKESVGTVENRELGKSEKIEYTPKELEWARQYFKDNYLPSFLTHKLNGEQPHNVMVYGTDEFFNPTDYNLTDKWNKDYPNIKRHLDNAVDKSSGLSHDTILYHAGRPDKSLVEGDKGVWKGYKSMSFQQQSMEKHYNNNGDYWRIIVLAPKGTKGICGNDDRFSPRYSYVDEHEYLLGRNMEYTVVSMDYATQTQVVILE